MSELIWSMGNFVSAQPPYDIQDSPFFRSVFFVFFLIARGHAPHAFPGVPVSLASELACSGKRYSSDLYSRHFLLDDWRNAASFFNEAAGQFSAVFLKNMSSISLGVQQPALDIYGRFSGHAKCHASPDKRQKTSSSRVATA
ncbi:hypothetical protein HK17_13180 [Acetobacter indonesiensis]|uniref:Uncharacterized protein n=1 Tax=Acetobacter indonesiensis TaxID=104101 RepID=A0A252AXG1_9PROT|nr:hypothetical protein HK17_13180 [Acetobacter indonesiensis]